MNKKVSNGFLSLDAVMTTVDEFIAGVLHLGYTLIKNGLDGHIMLKTSKELNEKLKDIPENAEVWEKIYREIPPCLLLRTGRAEQVDGGDNTGIIVFTDLKSKEGKKQAKFIKAYLNNFKV